MSGPDPSVAILRAKVSETENSLWYNAGRHQGKFTGAGVYLLLLKGRQTHKANHIGRALARGCAQNAGSVDTGQNGVKMILSLHQILNKPKLLEKH